MKAEPSHQNWSTNGSVVFRIVGFDWFRCFGNLFEWEHRYRESTFRTRKHKDKIIGWARWFGSYACFALLFSLGRLMVNIVTLNHSGFQSPYHNHSWNMLKLYQNHNGKTRPETNHYSKSYLNHISKSQKQLFWKPSILEPADVLILEEGSKVISKHDWCDAHEKEWNKCIHMQQSKNMHVQWFYILEGYDFTTCPYAISFKNTVPVIPIMKITGYGQTWENRFKPQRKA